MPYYAAGDYYGQGDYYRGDGIFSTIGKGLAGIAKVGLGALTGGPLGATKAAIMVAKTNTAAATLAAGSMPEADAATVAAINAKHAMILAAQPMGGMGMVPMIGAPMGGLGMLGPGVGLMTMSGYRPNKSTYAVRGGGTSRWGPAGMVRIIPKGTVPVKSRRMNVANPRALRRGLRRAAGFVKLARRAHVRLAAFTGRGKTKRKR